MVKKGEKNTVVTIIKLIVFVLVLVLQIVTFYFIYKGSLEFSNSFRVISLSIQVISVLYILYGHERLTYKIPWLILVVLVPVAGAILHLLLGPNRIGRKMRNARDKAINNSHYLLPDDSKIKEELNGSSIIKQVNLLKNLSGYPVNRNKEVKYFDIGEKYFESMIEDLKNAKEYILLEYFIIAKGKLFDRIYSILVDKLKEGVEVIILADGWGGLFRYPRNKMSELASLGAKVKRFNPIRFGVNTYINYRDHRKITVIDGKIAYTGGVNIADEYINEQIRFGHWKDNGIRLEGEVVKSIVIAFLKSLEIATNKTPDYKKYIKDADFKKDNTGYTLFYTDGPDNRKNPAENIYMEVINSAKEYVYIYTPYLLPSTELLSSILNAKRSGIDVRIITPHKPDKWYVHLVTKSYYDELVKEGVKVYEYLPGFMHAKTIVSDDSLAVVGTINLDYRSLNLNYECACLMYETGIENDIKEDFLNTIKMSKEITIADVKSKNIFIKMLESLLNTFGPLF